MTTTCKSISVGDIMDIVLSIEDYSHVDPSLKSHFAYKLAYLIKEEIRSHKWNMGSTGVVLSWEEARKDWLSKYYKDFMSYRKKSINTSKKHKTIAPRTFKRREPVISGHSL